MNSENAELKSDDFDVERSSEVAAFKARLERAKAFSIVAGVLGGAVGLCYSVAYVKWISIHPQLKTAIGAPFALAFAFSVIPTGIALLFAPPTFFTSERGKEYLRRIGTQNIVAVRIAILAALIGGCAIIVWITLDALHMAGLIDLSDARMQWGSRCV